MNNKYEFTIVIRDAKYNDQDLEDKLFEAGCDDALVCGLNNTAYLEFCRKAPSAIEAIQSAFKDIRSAGYSDLVIEENGFATLSVIAKRSGLTRQAISLYAKNERGAGDFPSPMYALATSSPLYSWKEVATWLFNNDSLAKNTYQVAIASSQH